VHRSRPTKINSLHGRPHIHFIATFGGVKMLGPDRSELLTGLNKLCNDINIKSIKQTLKDLINAHMYLLKEIKCNDILLPLKEINKKPLEIYLKCADMLIFFEGICHAISTKYHDRFIYHNIIDKHSKM
jgi:hypothetical protein